MVTLIPQLKADIKQAFENLNNSFKNTTVKDAYEELPKEQYPLVVIHEINNAEIASRSTTQGERTTDLGYQFDVLTRATEEYTAKQGANYMLDIIQETLTPPNYMMLRGARTPIIPDIRDNTIMTGNARYNCVYDYETNLIYKN